MLAAIYARKSMNQTDRSDEVKSVTRQARHATANAAERALAERHGGALPSRLGPVAEAGPMPRAGVTAGEEESRTRG